jgi:hypothetical protein
MRSRAPQTGTIAMPPLDLLHQLAARRGDGLDPRFLDLFAGQAARTGATVVDLARWRRDPHMQAGPHPGTHAGPALPAPPPPHPANAPAPGPRVRKIKA